MNKRQHCVCLQQMSSGLCKSTKSSFIAPLLPTTMVNNNMDTDSFDTPNSYPTPGQRQEHIAIDCNSDLDLYLNGTTLVSSVSKLEDYQKMVNDAIKKKTHHIDAEATQSLNDKALDRSSGCEKTQPYHLSLLSNSSSQQTVMK